jgi:hypothetical protein
MNTKKWKIKDGRKIRIKDMEDQHLINTIRMLNRQFELAKLNTPFPNFSGDMAQFYAEAEFDAFMDSTVEEYLPIYVDLEEELYRRNLEWR